MLVQHYFGLHFLSDLQQQSVERNVTRVKYEAENVRLKGFQQDAEPKSTDTAHRSLDSLPQCGLILPPNQFSCKTNATKNESKKMT